MTDPKKPGASDLDDLKARLGLQQPGGGESGQPPGGSPVPVPPAGIVPPAFGPAAVSPGTSPVPGAASGAIPPPGFGSSAPAGASPIPGRIPAPAFGSTKPSGLGASAQPLPGSSGAIPAPSFAVPRGGGAVPPPSFAAKADLVPPPFAQDDDEPEEEIIREERVVRIEQDETVDASEAGRSAIAPYLGVVVAFLLAGLFGYLAGAQIDRAVRANKAIDAAVTIHTALIQDQETAKGLKSRISGAARKAIDPDNPSADFVLLQYLSKIRSERPFTAQVWSGQFYQAFKSRSLVFEYYRSVQSLWDLVDETATYYEDPALIKTLKAWPEERQKILKINDTKGASGYGVSFHSKGGKVFATLGTFRNSRRENVNRKVFYKSEFTPLGSNTESTLSEYQPSFDPLSDDADSYFIRINPDAVVGKKRQVLNPGGPIISALQDPYRRYLGDLTRLSKSVQNVQGQQDNLIQALSDIRQASRPFTFGF